MSGRHKPPSKPILGVDIDNVLAESDACLRAMFREMFGIALDEHQMTQYDYTHYGVTEEQLRTVFRLFNTAACRTLELVPGAQAALVRLARLYEIALVTSRDPEAKEGTEYWLNARGLPYDQLHFNDDKHALGIPYHSFIEDRHEHAHRIAETGAAVYLLTRPWNAAPLAHPNVRRVRSWDEILEFLL